ncbi:MAG: helix-turn-helix domain-containing protein [Polyangiales bacterium]
MSAGAVHSPFEEAMRTMLREIIHEEVRAAVRECLAGVLAECSAQSARSTQVSSLREYLTVRDVARELQITEPTVREWIHGGVLRATRLGGAGAKRAMRIARPEFERFKNRLELDGGRERDLEHLAEDIVRSTRAKVARR